jgi:MarR family transcriptional regulator, transcriptional regulator for hemolysin
MSNDSVNRPPREPIGLQLQRTAKSLNRGFDDVLVAAGGSLPTWLILLSLKSGRPETQRELAAAVGIQGATLTHHLDALEKAGLVTRTRDPENRRVQRVSLTDEGDALFLRMRKAAMAWDAKLRRGISDEDADRLGELLGRLLENAGS